MAPSCARGAASESRVGSAGGRGFSLPVKPSLSQPTSSLPFGQGRSPRALSGLRLGRAPITRTEDEKGTGARAGGVRGSVRVLPRRHGDPPARKRSPPRCVITPRRALIGRAAALRAPPPARWLPGGRGMAAVRGAGPERWRQPPCASPRGKGGSSGLGRPGSASSRRGSACATVAAAGEPPGERGGVLRYGQAGAGSTFSLRYQTRRCERSSRDPLCLESRGLRGSAARFARGCRENRSVRGLCTLVVAH